MIPTSLLEGIVNHVFLPPRLPSQEDEGLWIRKLSELLEASLHEFKSYQKSTSIHFVSRAISAVKSFQRFNSPHGGIEESGLGEAISLLSNEGSQSGEETSLK
jgi:hypothetical protein